MYYFVFDLTLIPHFFLNQFLFVFSIQKCRKKIELSPIGFRGREGEGAAACSVNCGQFEKPRRKSITRPSLFYKEERGG